MEVEKLFSIIGADFYTGVPDSHLKPLCNFLMDNYGTDPSHHIIAANEGNCAAIAAGYHLATGRIPVVYMQNSGEGNIINPAASLLDGKVYAIPVIFIIGWRGEPGVHDEPQHIYQGEVTIKLLEDMGIEHFIISKDTTVEELEMLMEDSRKTFSKGKSIAFVVRKDALSYDKKTIYKNSYTIAREEAIKLVVKTAGGDPVVCTTGKASRELFEIRDAMGQGHGHDFLTVGSMGHASSIALGLAINKPGAKIWCIDGDGAMLMHMGAVAVAGTICPRNMIHIVINNGAHETVGGMPTAAGKINLAGIAGACGYPYTASVTGYDGLEKELQSARTRNQLSFIEVKCSIGARKDLGRPSIPPVKNKEDFMEYIKNIG